jgi:hypothetical protein
VAGLWYFSHPHPSREAQVSENSTMISALKDLPIKAVPFVIFLAACLGFGELFIRMPTATASQEFVAGAMAVFTIGSGLLFFCKCFLGWPPIHGLELVD